MTGNKISKIGALSILIFFGLVIETEARQRDYGSRGALRQSAGFSYSIPDFTPDDPSCLSSDGDGNCTVLQDYRFSDPVFGIFFSRPGILVSLGRGSQNGIGEEGGDLELLQTVIRLSGALRPFPGMREANTQFVVPVALHSGYRRVSTDMSEGSIDRFESTVLAIGIGVGVLRESGFTRISAHLMPFFGLASSSFGLGSGTSTLLDADVELTLGPVSGEIGIALGYSFRWQRWDLEAQFGSDQNFTGKEHGVRIGVFW
ncbi:MAG: hypothetical protein BMS9Abin05_0170 [Rhodothermia bacterium]|nr:MAG: hypothetical protein BMS9Abin05_0170 [Rhodothermia bacterium]